MTPENFAYWLQGFIELTQGQTPNPAQWKSIKEHLDLVFTKMTPPVGETTVKINVDAKDAQKAVEDLKKKYDELMEKAKEATPFIGWPYYSPIWLDEGTRISPGVTC